MYSKEEIEAARHTDMVRFLEQHKGFSFKTSGGWLICNEHDSLKINPDRYTWHWYSRDLFGKGAIDWLCKVDGCTVLAAYNVSFLDLALARYVEYNVVHVGMFRTEYHVVQFRLAGGNKYALAVLDDIGQFIGKGEFGEQ